ncbi:unnamed protein product [Phaeothamnion confervicola]
MQHFSGSACPAAKRIRPRSCIGIVGFTLLCLLRGGSEAFVHPGRFPSPRLLRSGHLRSEITRIGGSGFSAWIRFDERRYTEWLHSVENCTILTEQEKTIEAAMASGVPVIGTHSGNFHADEVLACALLKVLPELRDAIIVRSRNMSLLRHCNVLLDVGQIYDPNTLRFDHHMSDFAATLVNGKDTRLSSAGLVYKHFGRRCLDVLLGGPEYSKVTWFELYLRMYDNFIEQIDGMDNGINAHTESRQSFRITSHISAKIGGFNVRWNERSTPELENDRFRHAMSFCCREFLEELHEATDQWLPAKQIVEDMVRTRHEVHPSGKVACLASPCPWRRHLLSVEQEWGMEGEILFIIYPEDTRPAKGGDNGNGAAASEADADSPQASAAAPPPRLWYAQAVSNRAVDGRRRLRAAFPHHLRGLPKEELSRLLGIDGAVFVHNSGHIGGHETKEGALHMALAAMRIGASHGGGGNGGGHHGGGGGGGGHHGSGGHGGGGSGARDVRRRAAEARPRVRARPRMAPDPKGGTQESSGAS